jgi:hypothetical protein
MLARVKWYLSMKTPLIKSFDEVDFRVFRLAGTNPLSECHRHPRGMAIGFHRMARTLDCFARSHGV